MEYWNIGKGKQKGWNDGMMEYWNIGKGKQKGWNDKNWVKNLLKDTRLYETNRVWSGKISIEDLKGYSFIPFFHYSTICSFVLSAASLVKSNNRETYCPCSRRHNSVCCYHDIRLNSFRDHQVQGVEGSKWQIREDG